MFKLILASALMVVSLASLAATTSAAPAKTFVSSRETAQNAECLARQFEVAVSYAYLQPGNIPFFRDTEMSYLNTIGCYVHVLPVR